MGMFDYVRYEAPCVGCGALIQEWQSKDGPCVLDVLNPSEVKRFYGSCGSCRAWNEKMVITDTYKVVNAEGSL